MDWSKCYDRLRLSVLRSIATAAGLPGSISGPMLAAYGQARRVLCEGMAGALRVPNCGLAPGCPAATDWLGMLMYPWLVKAREAIEEEERRCRAYVDDLTAWAKGRGRVKAVEQLVADTNEFGEDVPVHPTVLIWTQPTDFGLEKTSWEVFSYVKSPLRRSFDLKSGRLQPTAFLTDKSGKDLLRGLLNRPLFFNHAHLITRAKKMTMVSQFPTQTQQRTLTI